MSTDREPDSATIDAWLAGELSPAEVAAIEQWFEENPESVALEDEPDLGELDGEPGDDAFLETIAGAGVNEEDAPVIDELIARITRSPDVPSAQPLATDAWKEVITLADEQQSQQGILGTLGHYEILEVIASGGMGIVFRARDPELKRIAALKVLAPDLAVNATARERFLREARAAATLEHENILPIYGVVDDGVPWFAMRYAAGGTLQDRLDRNEPIEFRRLKSITRQVAAALDAAHSNGIVHRDIKPANLLFDDDDEHLWVCDFGIARSTEDPGLTYPGAIAGTPKFMSPEQAAGKDLDGRSDLFSLGAVLYLCASGEHAFTGNTTAAVFRELGSDEPTRIEMRREELPLWFQRLLNNLLAKKVSDRPDDAAVVVQSIDDEHSPRPKRKVRRNRLLLRATISTAAVVLLVYGLLRVPAVEQAANSLLALRHERAFFIAGTIGAHPDLRQAIKFAEDGDTIRLPGGAPIGVDNLLVRSGKSLTLVAADPEQRPSLTTEIAGAPGLVTRSPLRLEGIDFVVNAKRDSDGVFIVDGSSASLFDCRFIARRNVMDEDEDIKARAIELRGKASIDVTACDFDLHDTNAITVLGETGDIRVSDSRIAAYYGVDLLGTDSDIERVNVKLENHTFSGQTFLRVNVRNPSPELRVEAVGCDFICARPACWFRTNEVNLVRSQTKWVGRDNKFRLGNALVQISANPPVGTAAALLPLEWFGDPATSGEPPMIVEEGTGERYFDLQEAVDKAQYGATLLLSGRIEIRGKEVITPEGKVLIFRRHPKSRQRPTVVSQDPRHHALFCFGPTTFSGIRFVRHDSSGNGLPVLGIRAGMEGEVLVEDCEFDALPSLRQRNVDGIGLSITNTKTATVRRCLFRCRKGIMAAFVENTEETAVLRVDDCVFIGHSAIHLYSRVPQADLQASLSRCVIYCRNAFSITPRSHPIPCQFSVVDSVLDIKDELINAPNRDFIPLQGRLTWQGDNNYYRTGLKTFQNRRTVPQTPENTYVDLTLRDFENLIEKFPGSMESGPQFGEPFDDDKLHPPLTPASLRAALVPEAESMVAEVLDAMDE